MTPPPTHKTDLPPVPFDELPILTDRVDEPRPPTPPRAEPEQSTTEPPHSVRPSPRTPQPATVSRNEPCDPAFAKWLAQRVQELVREELQLLTERVVARLEWEIGQRKRSDGL